MATVSTWQLRHSNAQMTLQHAPPPQTASQRAHLSACTRMLCVSQQSGQVIPRAQWPWAHGVVVSHPLRMRKALGSIPSVSIWKRHGRLQYDYSARASFSAANFRHTLQGFLPQGARVQCLTSRTLHARAGVVLWAVVVQLGTAAEEKQWRPQSTRDSVRKRRQQSDARDFFWRGLYDFAQTVSKSANKKQRNSTQKEN